MKKTNLLLTLGAALLLAPLTATFAQSTWQTVDDYQLAPGKAGGVAGMAATDNGVAFSSGGGSDAARLPHGFVRRSLDAGQNWSNVLDLPGASGCWSVTVGASGLVFATASANAKTWITARSADGGTSWSVVDSILASGTTATPFASVEDAAGRVFVGGAVSDAQRKDHFLIRRSLDAGTTWTSVDDIAAVAVSRVVGLTATPAGVFAAGRLSNTWTVRRSTDGGNTWATVDQYVASSGSFPYGITSDASGNLFVTGSANITIKKVTKLHWITRKSADGGLTWRTVDDVSSGVSNGGQAMTVDAFGRVFAAGQMQIGTTYHWITRASTDSGATWVTTDDYTPTATGAPLPRGAASDAVGNVFIGGQAPGADGVNHDIVRKLAAP